MLKTIIERAADPWDFVTQPTPGGDASTALEPGTAKELPYASETIGAVHELQVNAAQIIRLARDDLAFRHVVVHNSRRTFPVRRLKAGGSLHRLSRHLAS